MIPVDEALPGSRLRDARTPTRTSSRSGRRPAALAPGLLPYRTAIGHGLPLVMLSNATYTAWDAARGGRLVAGDQHDPAPGRSSGSAASRSPTRSTGPPRRAGYTTSHLAERAARPARTSSCVTGSEATSRRGLRRAPGRRARPARCRCARASGVVRHASAALKAAHLTDAGSSGRADRLATMARWTIGRCCRALGRRAGRRASSRHWRRTPAADARPARSASGSSTSARSPGRSARPSAPIRCLADVWVEGEVGRVTVSSAGHAYFTLKDARSTLNCVWFSDGRARSVFQPQAGLRIVVHGRIDLFEQQGAVQLYVESIQPAGFGDLAIRFEALKARLDAEGLFDPGPQAAAAAAARRRSRSSRARPASSGTTSRPCSPGAGR